MNTQKLIDRLSPAELKNYAERGILRITMENEIPMCITDTPEYQLFKKLKKKKIGVAEAARKYNASFQTMSSWKRKGFIKVLGHDGQKIFLDESFAAYCAYVYHLAPGQGRWAFNKNGTPRTHGTNLRNTV